jgi:NIPSNAP
MLLEIRTYRLKPSTRDEFVRVMREDAVPMLRQAGIDVVTCGASLVNEDGHEEAYLIRSFGSLAEHHEQEESFYASDAWRHGPRESILAKIDSYHSIVLETSRTAVDALRLAVRP